MADPVALDREWLRDHPLPDPHHAADKNARGRVVAIGGSRFVPGGLLLTVEAAFRAGAGKVQAITIASAAPGFGLAMPEAAVIGLPETEAGELAEGGEALAAAARACDALVAGPAMGCARAAGRVVDRLVGTDATLVLDAAALQALPDRPECLSDRASQAVLTPHAGELAALLGCELAAIDADPAAAAQSCAARYRAIVIGKGAVTWVATPAGELFRYTGGGVGLATSGSGDVLSGVVAGLAARGAEPLTAALWGVWLHGEAGRRLAEQFGTIGFLARELLPLVPGLLAAT